MKYVNRTMEKTLKKFIGNYPVILITGPRQVGKTTLLNYLSSTSKKKINYVTLDDKIVSAQASADPELFLRMHETPLVIDEFQYAPEILSYIKIQIDQARKDAMFGNKKEVGTLYYLTGSQIFETMKDVTESLAGRIGILDLYAFSTRELENSEEIPFVPDVQKLKKKKQVDRVSIPKLFERILKGSYPEINFNKNISFENYFRDYIRTYIERDIRKIINIKDENKFIHFLTSIAARTGQEFIAEHIGKEIGITGKTVDEWLSLLKNTGIIYLLKPYSNNFVARAIKREKIYFMDTGLACYLTGYTDSSILEKSAYNGAIFETYIISEIVKSYENNGIDPDRHLYFYRDNRQQEIDLIVNDNNFLYPVEIKKSTNPSREATKNFDVLKNSGYNIGNGVVLCLCKEITAIDDNNYRVPIEYI